MGVQFQCTRVPGTAFGTFQLKTKMLRNDAGDEGPPRDAGDEVPPRGGGSA